MNSSTLSNSVCPTDGAGGGNLIKRQALLILIKACARALLQCELADLYFQPKPAQHLHPKILKQEYTGGPRIDLIKVALFTTILALKTLAL